MKKFNNCLITYKSGDGESYIQNVYIDKNPIELTEDEIEYLEQKYDREIFGHDHDRNSGDGLIKVSEGVVIKSIYQEEMD